MRLHFTVRRLMAAVAVAALTRIAGLVARDRLWWSWRAVAKPAEWRAVRELDRWLQRWEAVQAPLLLEMRASRRRAAAEYRAEADRLRASDRSEERARAASMVESARDLEKSAADPFLGMTTADHVRRRDLALLRRVDLPDTTLLVAACLLAGLIVLIIPGPRRVTAMATATPAPAPAAPGPCSPCRSGRP